MRLLDLLKDKLQDPKGVISDNEMCVINRRDFIYSETNCGSAILAMYGAEGVSYEMRAIMDFLHAFVCRLRDPEDHVRVYQLSASMTLPAVALTGWVSEEVGSFVVYTPKGKQQVGCKDAFAKELLLRYQASCQDTIQFDEIGSDPKTVDIVLCNASSEADVAAGLRLFANVKRGLILIKGYGRHDAPNCGDLVLGARLNVHCSLAGFGFAAAI